MSATSDFLPSSADEKRNLALYDNAVAILRVRYFDKDFREHKLEKLAQRYRPSGTEAKDANGQRDCLTRLLSQLPASHLGVLSHTAFEYLIGELTGEKRPTLGLLALRFGDDYFTSFVLEGGPAHQAEILPWERIVSIDDQPIAQSSRLDYAQKDAYLSLDRDPPLHLILCRDGEEITLVLERTRAEQRTVTFRARPYSALEAAHASARVINAGGRKIAYVHFWFIHSSGVPELMRELFDGLFGPTEGLVLDLRGRGGNGVAVEPLLTTLTEWGRPIVALIDRQARSAKDALAHELRQRRLATVVGERSAGAVIPANFAPIGSDTVLMFPSFTLGAYTAELELKGVEPDIFVERAGPYSAGRDPILERGLKEIIWLASNTAAKPTATKRQTAAKPPSRSKTELPAIDSLLAGMINALGGEKALRAHEHRTLNGKTELVGLPMKGSYVQKASAPDKSLVLMSLGDLLVRQGFDGVTAWSESPMEGLKILGGAMAEAVKRQSRFHGPLDLVSSNKKVMPSRFVAFGNNECIELEIVSSCGDISYLYINAATCLIAGSKATIQTPIGSFESKTYLRDYHEVNGYKTATEIFVESSVQRQLIKIESASFDAIPLEEYAVPRSQR